MLYENDLDKLIKDSHTIDEIVDIIFEMKAKGRVEQDDADKTLAKLQIRRNKLQRRIRSLAGQPHQQFGGSDYAFRDYLGGYNE